MADKECNALIPLPAGGLENIGSGPKSILSGMVSDALALMRAREKPPMDCLTFPSGDRLTRARILEAKRSLSAVQIITSPIATRFRIGDYEFRDPDYRQILIWAKALGIAPEVVLEAFESSLYYFCGEKIVFKVEDGLLVNLVWNFNLLPISKFEWVPGLTLQILAFTKLSTAHLALRLPSLDKLHCSNIGLTELDLSNVPGLTTLDCDANQLTELDLSNVSKLAALGCRNNQLSELNLSKVPALTEIWCDNNHFSELGLLNVPKLKMLSCSGNRLVELDLSNVPGLTALDCYDNQLTELDLLNVPELTELVCGINWLAKLNLSNISKLEWLECSINLIAELDLSNIQGLVGLDCSDNELVELDIRGLGQLESFVCDPSVNLKKLPTQNF